jgi:hypothetical protein
MLLHACAAVVTALSLLGGAAAHAAEPEGELAHRLEAIVRIHADVPAEARTAAYLGTTRDGAGAVIDDGGLIVTIGYLITEAMGAEVTAANGRVSRADIVGFDIASGLGLLRAAEPLGVKPMPIGSAQELTEKTRWWSPAPVGWRRRSRRSWCRAERSGAGDCGGGLRPGRPARAIGLANLIIALHFDFVTWAWFVSVGAVGAKLVAFALHYGVFRTIIRQRIAPSAA